MPPSGYDWTQVSLVREFLSSCAAALKRESAESGSPLAASLRRECLDIHRAVDSEPHHPSAEAVLRLTGAFYKIWLDAILAGENAQRAEDIALEAVTSSVKAIHVEPSAISVR